MKPANALAKHLIAPTPEERFVEFQYAKMKDITKHFLTPLVLTLTEKLLGNSASETAKSLLGYSWASLIFAFIFAGAGLAGIFFAAIAAREIGQPEVALRPVITGGTKQS